MSESKGENAFFLLVRVCMCVLSRCTYTEMQMYLYLCVVENSSSALHSRNFPNANTYNFFHTVVLYIEALWFRFRLPHFVHSNKKKPASKKPTYIFSRLYSIVTLCDLCWHIVLLSQFYSLLFLFLFWCVLTIVRWVYLSIHTDICRSLIVIEPRSNKKKHSPLTACMCECEQVSKRGDKVFFFFHFFLLTPSFETKIQIKVRYTKNISSTNWLSVCIESKWKMWHRAMQEEIKWRKK